MAFTATDIARLEAAIAAGVRSVTFADNRRTEYQNTDQMLAALKIMRDDVASEGNAGRPRRRVTVLRVGSCR